MAQAAVPLEAPPDPLLAAYLEARRRYEPPPPAKAPLTDDLMLTRYLRARQRLGMPLDGPVNEPDIRTCPHCGERSPFQEEAGNWAACTTCGVYA